MNQIIIDNQHKIDTACQLCFYELDKYNNAVNAFQQKKREINQSTVYSQQEQERQVNKAAEDLANAAQTHYEEIKSNLGVIRIAAGEMENLLDIGEDLQNALSVVKALGAALPSETRWGLVNQFKGQQQALIILKAAYQDAGIHAADEYFKGLIFDTSARVDKLDDYAFRITAQPGTNILVVTTFGSELEKFADSLGVVLSKRFQDIVDTSADFSQILRAVMGVGTAD